MSTSREQKTGIRTLTFGCRLNAYETEVMKNQASIAGLGEFAGGVVLVNTCAVTSEAVRQAKQAIRKARRENPNARIIVSGCAAQTEPESFAAMAEVDLIIGNDDKLHAHNYRALPDFGVNDDERVRVNDIMSIRETASHMIDGLSGRARAFVQVQNGCDHRCTFCIIPYGRGNSRSVPMGGVVEQIARLSDLGHQEIVLTGVDITSYGADLPGKPTLGKLVQNILRQVPQLPRLRLSSIDSIEVDQPLLEVISSEKRLMPHLHLSIQSGDNMILKRMKRRHLREHTIEFCNRIRELRSDIVFGADLIAGFPTETEKMFKNTLQTIDECGLTYIHTFPFSSRAGTPAARMPQLEGQVVKERALRIRQSADKQYAQFIQDQIGKHHRVLIERKGMGRSENFAPVINVSGKAGEIVEAITDAHDGKNLIAVTSANILNQPQTDLSHTLLTSGPTSGITQ